MLGHRDAAANIAVKDMERARMFYEGTLGLKQVGSHGQELIAFRSGTSTLLVYRSQYAGTNKATALTWTVGDDVERIAGGAAARSVNQQRWRRRSAVPRRPGSSRSAAALR